MRILFVVALFLLSCEYGLEKPSAPADLIPKDEMTVILKDLAKLEAHIQQKYGGIDRYYKTMDRSCAQLLKDSKVSEAQFERSLKYYGEDQESLNEMYAEALNLLNQELGEIQSK